jgi:cytochrome P450
MAIIAASIVRQSKISAVFPPGPRGRLLAGNLAEIRRDPLAFVTRLRAEYGDMAHATLGPFHVYLLNHPDDIEQVLVTHHDRFVKGRTLAGARRLFGNGLLTSDGSLHAQQRRLVRPVFHRARMDDHAHIITTAATERREAWRDGDTVDIAGEMSRLTLTISARLLFGEDGDAVASQIAGPLQAASDAIEVALLPFAAWTDALPLAAARRLRGARAAIERVIRDLISQRRRDPRNRGDVLSLLLEMPDDQLCDEIITLLLASHETTANALAWTWYLLARHTSVEARVHAEADTHQPDPAFTRMVLAESMRLYPPAWLIARTAIADHNVRGYHIPRGAFVVMSPWVVHRDAKYYPDPESFDPDRWRPERQNGRPRFAYFPFGGGTRGCMGESFAWMEGVLVLSIVSRRWRLRLIDERSHPLIHPGLTLKPKAGMPVRLEQR